MKTTFSSLALVGGLAVSGLVFGQARERQQKIDVQQYTIDLRIDPNAQTLKAVTKVSFIPDDDATTLSFELNNALNLDKVTDESGNQIPASRYQQDMSVRLSLPQALPRGKAVTLIFYYDGKLTGDEESPVYGIKFAAIHPDFAYLMYPARWFPVNDYTADRFSSDFKVTVPMGYKVLASGTASNEPAPDGMTTTRFQFQESSFPGSLAVVKGDGKALISGGVTTDFYLRQRIDMADAYAQEFGRAMAFFTDLYGVPFKHDVTVVETEAGTPNGYAAPGLIFLAPNAIGKTVNTKLVANEVARQWWGTEVSAASRNHLWIENGMARYSELLYIEKEAGPGAMEQEVHDTYVTALTVEQPPLIQSARLEDYSPEFWAATAGKGAAVMHMLRGVVGDENFFKILKTAQQKFAWKGIATDDFRKITDDVTGQNLDYFFLQWIESSGAPNFTVKWDVFRTQKGFTVRGKVTQDLDLFRMPVQLHIETEGNPEDKTIEVVGTSTEFSVDTFGKPRPGGITLDPKGQVLHLNDDMRVAVAIRKGEQFVEAADYNEALKQYQKALDVKKNSSLAHYRTASVEYLEGNLQSAANEFKNALDGDLEPMWTEVWSHIYLGRIYDLSGQHDPRGIDQYKQALRTKDNTEGALEEAQKGIEHAYERPKTSTN